MIRLTRSFTLNHLLCYYLRTEKIQYAVSFMLADDSTKSDIEQLANRCGMRPQDVLTGIGIAAFDEEQEALDFCDATDSDVAIVVVWDNGKIIHENV